MRKISLAFALIASLFAVPAHADFTGKDAALATITFKNPGVCTAVVCVPVFQLYDGTNVVTLTTAGADAVSNTLTGQPVYSRGLVFNGTTWDRWQGNIKAASGAYAAGSLAAGAGVDGWNLTQGAIADAAVAAGASGTDSAKLRAISRDVGTIATNSALPLPAQSGIGNVNIGAVEAFAPIQNTIAASQTAQILSSTQGGGTGVAGDYLSHCNIQPGTTSPGAFSILNNATVIYSFPGGASSVSNLVGWSVPIGSISSGGGWKITTTTNITGTCFGKFT